MPGDITSCVLDGLWGLYELKQQEHKWPTLKYAPKSIPSLVEMIRTDELRSASDSVGLEYISTLKRQDTASVVLYNSGKKSSLYIHVVHDQCLTKYVEEAQGVQVLAKLLSEPPKEGHKRLRINNVRFEMLEDGGMKCFAFCHQQVFSAAGQSGRGGYQLCDLVVVAFTAMDVLWLT
jgi:hypothetical protein